MSNRFRIVASLLLMLGAVMVDFVSGFISFAFDAFFIGSAVYMLWPIIKDCVKKEVSEMRKEIKEKL